MVERLKRKWLKSRLKDSSYSFLFDEPPKDEYVCIDTETTGLDPKKDEIISVAAVKIVKNRIEVGSALHMRVSCKKELDAESIKIHHMRQCDIESHSLKPDIAMERLLRFIGSRTLVGYYLEFDKKMIEKWTKPTLGIPLPNRLIEVSALYYDKKIGTIPQGHVDLRFDTMMQELDIPYLGKHDALNDALMTAMMFLKLNATKKL